MAGDIVRLMEGDLKRYLSLVWIRSPNLVRQRVPFTQRWLSNARPAIGYQLYEDKL